MSYLPANNISQQLFQNTLANCTVPLGSSQKPAPCCASDTKLEKWFLRNPTNLWNSATNYNGGQGFSKCSNDAFIRQCMLSQHYKYLSHNVTLNKY